jgi:selenocysteine-specific translation elongation factor
MPVQLAAVGQAAEGMTALLETLGLPTGGRVAPIATGGPAIAVIERAGHDELVGALLEAGPRGVDAYLLAIPADEEITAETREHAALLRALGVHAGLTVITVAEMADPASVLRESRELIPGTQAHAVSLRTADGLPELRHALAELIATLPARVDPPAAAFAGERPPAETRVLDAALDFGPRREREPDHGVDVIVHLGGRQSPASLHRLGGRFWQVRLDGPLLATAGDRFVIRRPDPPDTLGGGVVLDPAARRHPTSNEVIVRLTRIWRGHPPLAPGPPRSS